MGDKNDKGKLIFRIPNKEPNRVVDQSARRKAMEKRERKSQPLPQPQGSTAVTDSDARAMSQPVDGLQDPGCDDEFAYEETDGEESERNLSLHSAHVRQPSISAGSDGASKGTSKDAGSSSAIYQVRRGYRGRFELHSEDSNEVQEESRKKKKGKSRDMSWLLSSAPQGGPAVFDVIPSFGGHVALDLWSGSSDRGVLRGHTRMRALTDLGGWNLGDEALALLSGSGLSHLRTCMIRYIDLPLLSAFIERWQPDTNTFHMPFGEMTILLHDVSHILALPIDGDVCSAPRDALDDPEIAMCELLGFASTDELRRPYIPGKKFPVYKAHGVLPDALRQYTSTRDDETRVQGYLMCLLGSSIFVDKSGDRVSACIYHLLRDVGRVKNYAWGAATLAWMYRQLGIASRAQCRGLAGCLTLLQAWIYEYFPSLRPRRNVARVLALGEPRSLLWDTRGRGGISDAESLRFYRRELDDMTVQSVCWEPYGPRQEMSLPRTVFTGCIRYLDVIEPYQPDRCLRQFGYRQVIPDAMQRPEEHYRPANQAFYTVVYPQYTDYLWEAWRTHQIHLDRISSHVRVPGEADDEYDMWYSSHSHPYIIGRDPDSPRERDRAAEHDRVASTILHELDPIFSVPEEDRERHSWAIWKRVDAVKPLYDQFRGTSRPHYGRGRGRTG